MGEYGPIRVWRGGPTLTESGAEWSTVFVALPSSTPAATLECKAKLLSMDPSAPVAAPLRPSDGTESLGALECEAYRARAARTRASSRFRLRHIAAVETHGARSHTARRTGA